MEMKRIFAGADGLRPVWGVLLFLSLTIGLQVVYGVLLVRLGGVATMETPAGMLRVELVRGAIVVGVTLLMALIEKRSWQEYGLKTAEGLRLFLQGSAWGFLALSMVFCTLAASGLLSARLENGPVTGMIRNGCAWLLAYLCVAANEELTFRGYLQQTLGRSIGFWKAASVLSAWFALGHLGNAGESLLGLLQTAWIAMFFCMSLWATGSLWWPMGFHALWDWSESFFYGVPDSGLLFRDRLMTSTPHGSAVLSGGQAGLEGSVVAFLVLVVPGAWLLWVKRQRKARAVIHT